MARVLRDKDIRMIHTDYVATTKGDYSTPYSRQVSGRHLPWNPGTLLRFLIMPRYNLIVLDGGATANVGWKVTMTETGMHGMSRSWSTCQGKTMRWSMIHGRTSNVHKRRRSVVPVTLSSLSVFRVLFVSRSAESTAPALGRKEALEVDRLPFDLGPQGFRSHPHLSPMHCCPIAFSNRGNKRVLL